MTDRSAEALIIFVRNPEIGKVKTRLAKGIGKEAALKVYLRLLEITRNVSMTLPIARFLYYDSRINLEDDWSSTQFIKRIQTGDDLGSRMYTAFRDVYSSGFKKIVLIGSDCPEISPAILEEAFSALTLHDFVIGPAKDGGYYLLGMTRPEIRLLQEKNWSTETVLSDTLKDVSDLKKSCHLLPELSDLDTAEDLNEVIRALLRL